MPIQAVKFGKLQQVESQVTSPHLRLLEIATVQLLLVSLIFCNFIFVTVYFTYSTLYILHYTCDNFMIVL